MIQQRIQSIRGAQKQDKINKIREKNKEPKKEGENYEQNHNYYRTTSLLSC